MKKMAAEDEGHEEMKKRARMGMRMRTGLIAMKINIWDPIFRATQMTNNPLYPHRPYLCC